MFVSCKAVAQLDAIPKHIHPTLFDGDNKGEYSRLDSERSGYFLPSILSTGQQETQWKTKLTIHLGVCLNMLQWQVYGKRWHPLKRKSGRWSIR